MKTTTVRRFSPAVEAAIIQAARLPVRGTPTTITPVVPAIPPAPTPTPSTDGNVDGGGPASAYGGAIVIDGGGP